MRLSGHYNFYSKSGQRQHCFATLVEIITMKKKDSNIKDKWGRAEIHMAVETDRRNSAKFLIEYPESDINAQDNDLHLLFCV